MTLTLALTTSGSRASYLAAYNIYYGAAHTILALQATVSETDHVALKELNYYYSFLLESEEEALTVFGRSRYLYLNHDPSSRP